MYNFSTPNLYSDVLLVFQTYFYHARYVCPDWWILKENVDVNFFENME